MKTTFKTNLNCQNCVSKVRPFLDAEPEITTWRVETANPDKLLTIETPRRINADRIVELVGRAGFEAEKVAAEPHEAQPAADVAKEPFRLSTYRPLLLVLAYVIGLTLYTQYASGHYSLHESMRLFMGYFFLAFAFFKLLDVGKFADAFATYDVVAARSRLYAILYPWIEVSLGLAYLFNVFPIATNAVTLFIMIVGLVGVISAVRQKRTIQCACLGTAFNLPMSVVTIIENGVMALMAAMAIQQFLVN